MHMWTGIDMGIHIILIKLYVSLNYYVRLIKEILPFSLSLSLSLSLFYFLIMRQIEQIQYILNVDTIISLPKLKRYE